MGLMVLGASAPQSRSKKATHKTGTTAPADNTFAKEVTPLVKKYCAGCHAGGSPSAGISLVTYKDTAAVLKGREVWQKVARAVSDGRMPPQGVPAPTQAEREKIAGWVETTISNADCKVQDPGRVTLRRLNREEYNNTIRDLLGVDIRPADEFPNDDVGYGFDNIGDVLSISPLLMEKYLNAAEKVTKVAIITPETAAQPSHFDAANLPHTAPGNPLGKGYLLASEGEVSVDYTFTKDGEYTVRVNAFGQQAGTDPARMELRLDNKPIHLWDVTATARNPANYEWKITTAAGKHHVALAFTNDYYNAADPNPRNRDRNLAVNTIEIVSPPGMPSILPESHQRLFTVHPTPGTEDACARKILGEFARRAYRRPVTAAEVERLAKYVKIASQQGESFERGIQVAVQAALVSPNFLFRVEVDPKPNDPKSKRLLSDYEVASRLSYFLWSSMPDEELFRLASKGKLQDSKTLEAQVHRMLKDPKAKALGSNFAGQWLQLRNLANVSPDTGRFPEFNDRLRTSMRTETEMFFNGIVADDRSVLDFLDAKYTYLNEPLAKLYGINGVQGDQFRRVALTGNERGGLLTQASVLTVTSNPTRTSPVKRGKWVLEQIFGTPPPPAPPNVPTLADDKKGPLVGTLRQRMEQHRKNPICASCHASMDPIGFGLENFNAVGAWRTKDGDSDVDSSGVLPNGQKFNGPAQLKTILMSRKNQFVKCLSEKLLTYALGRGMEPSDKCYVDNIVKTTIKNDYRFSALIVAIVESDPFRQRRGDGGSK